MTTAKSSTTVSGQPVTPVAAKKVVVKPVDVLPAATRKISVTRQTRDVTVAGEVIGTIYDDQLNGEGAKKVIFSRGAGRKPKTIGLVSDRFSITNHDDVLNFVRDEIAHAEPTTVKVIRGGLEVFAVFKLAQYEMDDPINWDLELFPEEQRAMRQVFKAIIVRTSIREGHCIIIQGGWWRQICTNGMTVPIRQLTARIQHNQWLNRDTIVKNLTMLDTLPELGSGEGAGRLATRLQAIAKMQEENTLPDHFRAPFAPFLRLPGWYQTSLAEQLFAAANVQGRNLNYMDVANAVTTPLFHQARGDRFLTRQDALTGFIGNILTYYSI